MILPDGLSWQVRNADGLLIGAGSVCDDLLAVVDAPCASTMIHPSGAIGEIP